MPVRTLPSSAKPEAEAARFVFRFTTLPPSTYSKGVQRRNGSSALRTKFVMLNAEELEVLGLSLRVAFWSVAVSLPIAIAIALMLARADFPGKSVVDALVHLPLVLPPVVIGYFLLLLLGRRGVIGAWLDQMFGVVVAFRWTGAAVASAIMGFPLMVRAIRLSLEAIDRKLEDAASTLGASPLWVFLAVTLPLCLPGIITGMLLSFARSLGEFGATITFVSNIPGETRTLPLAIYSYTQTPSGDPQALRLSAIAVVLSLVALVVSEMLARQAYRRVQGGDKPGHA